MLWVEWPDSGKKMPIDVGPVATGNLVVTQRPKENKLIVETYDPQRHEGRRRFVSHFATCSQSRQHRKAP